MTTIAIAANLALGTAYLAVGTLVLLDIRRQRGTFGTDLAWALVAMAYTCGPHHAEHGLHLALGGDRLPGPLDAVTVLVGLPPAAIYAYLAVEAYRGGRGDRTIDGAPRWLATLGFAGVAYATVYLAFVLERLPEVTAWHQLLVPNVALIGVYLAIGVVILRTQVVRHPLTGSWSLSGLSLGMIFPTCAAMHATWVLYGALGSYAFDRHLLIIDWLSVPAGLYFLWVVHRMRRQALEAWDGGASPSLV